MDEKENLTGFLSKDEINEIINLLANETSCLNFFFGFSHIQKSLFHNSLLIIHNDLAVTSFILADFHFNM